MGSVAFVVIYKATLTPLLMTKIFKRFFSVESLIPKNYALDEYDSNQIPSTKRAYLTTASIAWPSALESILISLVGAVDTIMVGSISTGAIAAVGITNQPKFILLAVIFSLNTAITAITARRKGEGDQARAVSSLKQGIMICITLSFILSLLGFFFAREIMTFAGAAEDIINDAVLYFQIITVSLLFVSLSITINAAQRGVGNTKVSMTTNVTSNLVNALFNFLLINGIWFFPKMGIAGAGIATLLGSMAAFAMSLISVLKPGGFLHIKLRSRWAFDRQTIKTIINLGSSSLVEQLFLRIGFFSYAKVVAELGTVAFATHQIGMSILNFSFGLGDGLGIASSSLVGQNLGAKRPDLAILYGRIGQRIAFCISTVLFFLFIFFSRFLISVFSPDPDVISLGSKIMIIMALTTHTQTSQVVFSGCLRGAGDTKFVALVSLVSVGILRPILTYLLCLPLGLGLIGAWISLVIDQAIRYSACAWRFKKGEWTKIKV